MKNILDHKFFVIFGIVGTAITIYVFCSGNVDVKHAIAEWKKKSDNNSPTVYGSVINGQHEYIKDAKVSIVEANISRETGNDGVFQFVLNDSFADRPVTIKVIANGYNEYRQQITPSVNLDPIKLQQKK